MSRMKTRAGVLAIDPFEISTKPTPAQKAWAEWFVKITEGIPEGQTFHIRRIHYRTLGILKPDGTLYENTTNDAALLARASEYARYLELVDYGRIVDHKNEGVTVQTIYNPDVVEIDPTIRPKSLTIDEISNFNDLFNEGDGFYNFNFDTQSRQPYHLEMWVEKSTLNDVLI
jgi:hypothetical protein